MKWTAYCLDCKKDVLNGEQWNNGEMVEGQARFHIHGEGQKHDLFLHHRVIVGFIVDHPNDCYCNRQAGKSGSDGRLDEWEVSGPRLIGKIYGDSKGRFPDGAVIKTSEVRELLELKPICVGQIVHSEHSHYILGNPK